METERGGWTLVATKVSPGLFLIKTVFSAVGCVIYLSFVCSFVFSSEQPFCCLGRGKLNKGYIQFHSRPDTSVMRKFFGITLSVKNN